MLWKDEIKLISKTTTIDDIGDTVEAEKKTPVSVNKMAYRTSAVTEALRSGLKPKYSFEIREFDYSDQDKIEYDGIVYKVISTAPKKNECIEIVCEGVV